MNKRQLKKIRKNKFIDVVTTANENDILIFQFDIDKTYPEQLNRIHKYLSSKIDNEIIFLPKQIELIEKDVDSKSIVEYLNRIIEKLDQ